MLQDALRSFLGKMWKITRRNIELFFGGRVSRKNVIAMRVPPVSCNDLFDLLMLRPKAWTTFAKLIWQLSNDQFDSIIQHTHPRQVFRAFTMCNRNVKEHHFPRLETCKVPVCHAFQSKSCGFDVLRICCGRVAPQRARELIQSNY